MTGVQTCALPICRILLMPKKIIELEVDNVSRVLDIKRSDKYITIRYVFFNRNYIKG